MAPDLELEVVGGSLVLDLEINTQSDADYFLVLEPGATGTTSWDGLTDIPDDLVFTDDLADVATSGSYSDLTGTPSLSNYTTKDGVENLSYKTLVSCTFNSPKVDYLKDSSGSSILSFVHSASAANYLEITNKPTGYSPYLSAVGPDANIGMYLRAKGVASLSFYSGSTLIFQNRTVSSAVNYLYTQANTTGNAAIIASQGSDTDVDIDIQTKNDGIVKLNSVAAVDVSSVQTLTGKLLSGASNTFSNIPQSAITNLTTDLAGKATSAQGSLADSAIQPEDLGAVATSNDYGDLDNLPSLFSGDYDDLSNKPSLFDGAYDSLSGLPTLGTAAATASTDYATSSQGALADSAIQPSDLGAVATSNDYNDLDNLPSLFSGDYTDLSSLPTLFSGDYDDLSNKPTLFDGAYSSLSGLPTLGSAAATDSTAYATSTQGGLADSAVQPGDLATVATSGDYTDLSSLPSLFSGSYTDLTDKPSLFDGAYSSLSGAPDLSGYATKTGSETLTNKTLTSPAISSAALTGTITTTGQIQGKNGSNVVIRFNTDGTNGAIDIGRQDNVASNPFIDFNSGSTTVDYDVRLQATGGDGVAGHGTFNIWATTINANGNPVATKTGAETLTNKTLTSPTINSASIVGPTISNPNITGTLTSSIVADATTAASSTTTKLVNNMMMFAPAIGNSWAPGLLQNDIQFNTFRGGSVTVKRNGSALTDGVDFTSYKWFNAGELGWSGIAFTDAATDSIEITVDMCAPVYWWPAIGLIQGPPYHAKNCVIEAYWGGAWNTLQTTTNSDSGMIFYKGNANAGSGITKLRFTLSNMNGTGSTWTPVRIYSIFIVDTISGGAFTKTFVSRSGGYFYGTNANPPMIGSSGSDSNIDFLLTSQGTGKVKANGVEVVTLTGTQTITNKTFTSPTISTISNTGTLTLPTTTGTLALTSDIPTIPTQGYLAPCHGMTLGNETFTISGGSVTQIAGTTINGYTPNIGDRILIGNAPASTGSGSGWSMSTQPANGIYTVTGNTTNLSVSRATDMSGSVNPSGKAVYVQQASWPASQTVFYVTTPNSDAAFTWGTTSLAFTFAGGPSGQMKQLWITQNSSSFGIYNGSGWTNIQPTASSGTQTLSLPATATSDTLVGRASTDTLTNKTMTSPKITLGNAPSAISDPGSAGQIESDGSYLYVYNGSSWGRTELTSW